MSFRPGALLHAVPFLSFPSACLPLDTPLSGLYAFFLPSFSPWVACQLLFVFWFCGIQLELNLSYVAYSTCTTEW